MKLTGSVLTIVFLAVMGTACPHNPPGGVPTGAGGATQAGPVNCFSGIAQSAIADAVARIDTVIATGVESGQAEATVIKNLEGLAVDLSPQVFACALQYVASKFDYDASKSAGPVAANKAIEAQTARDYIERHQIVFAPGN